MLVYVRAGEHLPKAACLCTQASGVHPLLELVLGFGFLGFAQSRS